MRPARVFDTLRGVLGDARTGRVRDGAPYVHRQLLPLVERVGDEADGGGRAADGGHAAEALRARVSNYQHRGRAARSRELAHHTPVDLHGDVERGGHVHPHVVGVRVRPDAATAADAHRLRHGHHSRGDQAERRVHPGAEGRHGRNRHGRGRRHGARRLGGEGRRSRLGLFGAPLHLQGVEAAEARDLFLVTRALLAEAGHLGRRGVGGRGVGRRRRGGAGGGEDGERERGDGDDLLHGVRILPWRRWVVGVDERGISDARGPRARG